MGGNRRAGRVNPPEGSRKFEKGALKSWDWASGGLDTMWGLAILSDLASKSRQWLGETSWIEVHPGTPVCAL